MVGQDLKGPIGRVTRPTYSPPYSYWTSSAIVDPHLPERESVDTDQQRGPARDWSREQASEYRSLIAGQQTVEGVSAPVHVVAAVREVAAR